MEIAENSARAGQAKLPNAHRMLHQKELAAEYIRKAGKPIKSREIIRELHITNYTVYTILHHLRDEKRIRMVGPKNATLYKWAG